MKAFNYLQESWPKSKMHTATQHAGCVVTAILHGVDRKPKTVIHVKRAKMLDPMG